MKDNKSTSPKPKAYRIYPMYHRLFYSCLAIINRDDLSDYLIRKYYQFKDIPRMKDDNKGSVLEMMIMDVVKETDNIETVRHVLTSARMIHLREYFLYKNIDIYKPRKGLVIRLSDKASKEVQKLAKNTGTIGEVIEIAIAYHITNAPSAYYDLITFTIQNQAREEQENEDS